MRSNGRVAAIIFTGACTARDLPVRPWTVACDRVRNLSGTEMDTGYLVAQRTNGEVFIVRSETTLARANVPG